MLNTVKDLERSQKIYPTKQSSILPLLYNIQQRDGHITPEGITEVAKACDASPAYVQSVASFYTMYFKKPVGKNIFAICTNISCALCEGDELLRLLEKLLGIKAGETTKDGLITLLEVECLGSCGTAPVAMVNENYEENLTIEKVTKIIEGIMEQSAEEKK